MAITGHQLKKQFTKELCQTLISLQQKAIAIIEPLIDKASPSHYSDFAETFRKSLNFFIDIFDDYLQLISECLNVCYEQNQPERNENSDGTNFSFQQSQPSLFLRENQIQSRFLFEQSHQLDLLDLDGPIIQKHQKSLKSKQQTLKTMHAQTAPKLYIDFKNLHNIHNANVVNNSNKLNQPPRKRKVNRYKKKRYRINDKDQHESGNKEQRDYFQHYGSFLNQPDKQTLDLQNTIFEQIVSCNQKACDLKRYRLSQEQIWFVNKTKSEIDLRIKSTKIKIQLQKMLDQVKKARQQIQEYWLEESIVCWQHRNKIYYVCHKQYAKKLKFLCNECILDISKKESHKSHPIACIKHSDAIKYKSKLDLFKDANFQEYFCCQCLIEYGIQDIRKISLVTPCHFEPISQICFEEDCIKSDNFIVCQICKTDEHTSHHMKPFSLEIFRQTLWMEQDQKIQCFQQPLIRLKSILQLNPIEKLLNSYIQSLWPIIKFLESFGVWGDQILNKWIHQFFLKGRKEDLYVLWGVNQLNQRQYSENRKLQLLQIYTEIFSKGQSNFFQQMNESLNQLRNKFQKIVYVSSQQAMDKIKLKFSALEGFHDNSNQIRTKDGKVYHLDNPNLQFIKNLKIDMSFQLKVANCMQKWRMRRTHFFKNRIWEQLRKFQLSKYQGIGIFDVLMLWFPNIKYTFIYPQSLKSYLLEKLLIQYNEIQKQQQAELLQCPLLQTVYSRKFTKLITIHIRGNWNKNQTVMYALSAFKFFNIVYNNQQLRQFNVDGLVITQFSQFCKYFRIIKDNKNFIFKEKDQDSKYYVNNENVKQYVLDSRWEGELLWIKQLQFMSAVFIIPVQFQYEFNAFSDEKVNDLRYLVDNCKSIGYISLNIQFRAKNQQYGNRLQQEQLSQLLETFSNIAAVLISLNGSETQFNKPIILKVQKLLLTLSEFKQVIRFSLANINFNGNFDFSCIESCIGNLFSNNNITHVRLVNCPNVPMASNLQSIQYIQIHDSNFKNPKILQQLIENSDHLKFISIQNIQFMQNVSLQRSKKIQTLQLACNLPKNIQYGFIKHLQLKDFKGYIIVKDLLLAVFRKLIVLQTLRTMNINYDGKQLQQIPSLELTQLHIINNLHITNKCFVNIDRKWPSLSKITIWHCKKISKNIFRMCTFKDLFMLTFNGLDKYENLDVLKYLKMRGIRVINTLNSEKLLKIKGTKRNPKKSVKIYQYY